MSERIDYSQMTPQERNAEFSQYFDFVHSADLVGKVERGELTLEEFSPSVKERLDWELSDKIGINSGELLSHACVTDSCKLFIKGYLQGGAAGLGFPVELGFAELMGVGNKEGGIFHDDRSRFFEAACFLIAEEANAQIIKSGSRLASTVGVQGLANWRREFRERYGQEPKSLLLD